MEYNFEVGKMIPVEVKRIIEVVEKDRKKKINEMKESGNSEAKNIAKICDDECNSLKEKILDDYKKKAEFIKRKNLADIEIKKRDSVKKFKSEAAKKVKEEAIKELTSKGYEKLLSNFLERGLEEFGNTNLEISVRKEDVKFVRIFLKDHDKIGVKTIETAGGCLIRSGKITANFLIESLLERKEKDVDRKINELFFRG